MSKFNVRANDCAFGEIEAATAQDARDIAAKMAGYKSESDMIIQIESSSEIVAVLIEE
jgi:hypothetical protein